MRKRHSFLLTAFLMLLLAVPVHSAVDAVTAMQSRYAAMKSMRAEFIQTLTHKESGNREERRGVLSFAKPSHIRWETVSPIPELLLITPEAVWNIFPDEDMAYKYSAAMTAESEGIIQVVTGQSKLDKDFAIATKSVANGMVTLTLYPNTPTPSMTEVELVVETETGLIKRVAIIDFYYNCNEIVFTSQAFDQVFDTSLFSYTPPEGTMVEDRTQRGPGGIPLMQ